jgi:thymidylate synthase (FAD)
MRIDYIDHMGDDLSVVNAARVSFSKCHYKYIPEKDDSLIKYLGEHKHEIPFAHTCITLRATAPLPIRTQCFKHKIGLVENEESRRYIKTKPTFYIPKEFRKTPEGSIKQGSSTKHRLSSYWKWKYKEHCTKGINLYLKMIASGVCPEQARFVLPQGVEVTWIWTGSLLAFARIYNLRSDSHAQKEIQELSSEIQDIIEPLYPQSWKALTSRGKYEK